MTRIPRAIHLSRFSIILAFAAGCASALALDLNGNIVEVDDGGVYRRSATTTNSGDWTSVAGTAATGIGGTEMYSVAYDNHGHVVLAGTQDNGTIEQTTPGTREWFAIYAKAGSGSVITAITLAQSDWEIDPIDDVLVVLRERPRATDRSG